MPITELATLTLAPTISPNNPTLKSHLRRAKHAMQSYTSHPFYYYTSPPSPPSPHPHAPQQPTPKIYILGQWASLAQHTSGFIPSAQNQELLSLLGDYMAVESLVHIDVPSAVLPLGGDGLGVVRMRVGGEERCRERVVARLGRREDVGVGAEGKVGFGWTVEDGAELVVVSSWATGGVDDGKRVEDWVEGLRLGGLEGVQDVRVERLVRFDVGSEEVGERVAVE